MLRIKSDVSLKDLTTLALGGNASYYAEIRDISDLNQTVSFSRFKRLPILVLGEGSNVLIDDDTVNAFVVRLKNDDIKFTPTGSRTIVTCGSGLHWDKLVSLCVKRDLGGIECLSGIPGTVGAAPVQNIGAYGQELKDTFYRLKAYDLLNNCFVSFNSKQCKFEYRDSIFKSKSFKKRFIIWEIALTLTADSHPNIKYESLRKYLLKKRILRPGLHEVRKNVLELRNTKLENPLKIPNAGSFFKNPHVNKLKFEKLFRSYSDVSGFETADGRIKLFAGWLIEKAGWKGRKYKNVAVSSKNALVLTNPNKKGTTKEVLELSEMIIKDVLTKFDVKLEPEVQRVYSIKL